MIARRNRVSIGYVLGVGTVPDYLVVVVKERRKILQLIQLYRNCNLHNISFMYNIKDLGHIWPNIIQPYGHAPYNTYIRSIMF